MTSGQRQCFCSCERKIQLFTGEILNKTVLFNASKVHGEKIKDTVMEYLPTDNEELNIVHEPGTNAFSLRREDGK